MSSRDTARSLLMTSQITNCEMCRCFGEAGRAKKTPLRFRFQRSDARDSPTGKMIVHPDGFLLLLFLHLHTPQPPPPLLLCSNPYLYPIFQNSLFQPPLSPQGSAITCMHESWHLAGASPRYSTCSSCHPKINVRACRLACMRSFFSPSHLLRRCGGNAVRHKSTMGGKYVSCPCEPSKEREIYFCPHKWRCSNSLR